MKGKPDKTGKQRRKGAAVKLTKHHDDAEPGLWFSGKRLNTNEVKRAKNPMDVLPVCLAHNLRQGNEHHRHRPGSIDPTRTHLNTVLRGQTNIDAAVAAVGVKLGDLGIKKPRIDAIMGVELVIQPPDGWDRPEFWQEVMAWVESRYQHVVSAVVHRDQRSVHAHVIALAVQDGRLAGDAMTRGNKRFTFQHRDFMAHMRNRLGIRPDRQPKSLERLALSTGRGPKTRAAAERRDRALLKLHSAGKGVDGHGGRSEVAPNPHAQAQEPTPFLRSPGPSRSTAPGATETHSPPITRACPPPPAVRPATTPPGPPPPTVAPTAAPALVRQMPHRFVIPPGLFARGQPPPAETNDTADAMQPGTKEAA